MTTAGAAAVAVPARGRYSQPRNVAPSAANATSVTSYVASVVAGLLALMAVSVAAIVVLSPGNGQNVVAVPTGSVGVIGTVVGAYFGVKLGADGRQAAQHAQRAEAAKVQALAAHLDTDHANQALAEAGQLNPR